MNELHEAERIGTREERVAWAIANREAREAERAKRRPRVLVNPKAAHVVALAQAMALSQPMSVFESKPSNRKRK